MHMFGSIPNYHFLRQYTLWILILIINYEPLHNHQMLCSAAPSSDNSTNSTVPYHEKPEKLILTDLLEVGNYSRHYSGDVFFTRDYPNCEADICVGLSSGTAGLYVDGQVKEIDIASKLSDMDNCKCQCLPHLNTYREDLSICVDDIRECTLAPFVSGSTSEKIPFVFLPLRGQIIHPSKEISFPGVHSPVCAVSGSQFLTRNGWTELRNPIDLDVPFRLFRDEGRTFLQWLGETELRVKMQGRLILVHLMCRDVLATLHNQTQIDKAHLKPKIFTPCVAFRVVGTPLKHINNVTEVMFASETQIDESSGGLSTKEYVVIAICSLCLGLIYITSVFLYIHIKKKKSPRDTEAGGDDTLKDDFTYQQNDQVTFGTGIGRASQMSSFGGVARSSLSGRSSVGGSQRQMGHRGLGATNMNLPNEEMGVVKNNPLLKHYPNLNDNAGFLSDTSNSNSEFEEMRAKEDSSKNIMQTPVHVHPSAGKIQHPHLAHETFSMSSQESERLPEENVSITEEMTNEDKLENMKAIVSGSTRRKLYFNPAYFEPHLLLSPPPAAVEFLSKIREVISIAKYKMAAKRYQPSLLMIPEESQYNGSELNANQTATTSRKSSFISSKLDSSRKSVCSGCPGCGLNKTATGNDAPTPSSNCKNCGDKQSSIRKWLESVSSDPDNENSDDDTTVKVAKDLKTKLELFANKKKEKSPNHIDSSSDDETVKNGHPPVGGSHTRTTNSPPKVIQCIKNKDQQSETQSKTSHYGSSGYGTEDLLEKIHNAHSSRGLSVSSDYASKNPLYSQLSQSGSEIYNNPQFRDQNSPELSHRPRMNSDRGAGKHTEVLDQYANPRSLSGRNLIRNLHQMPDMVYEALAMDINKNNSRNNQSGIYSPYQLPTPDYTQDDESQPGTFKKYSRNNRGGASDSSDMDDSSYYVPTPDYNTLSKRSEKRYQPDSPIYSRKSPYNLIVDYETDSLERATLKNRRSETTPSHTSSDLSSQPSPSLSTALPLEEELEIRNAIYDRVEGFRKDTDTIKKEREMMIRHQQISEKLSKNEKSPKIIYDSPYVGSMTIELQHSPEDCDQSTDSDQFEPDTLDRKPKKAMLVPSKYVPALLKSSDFTHPYQAYLPKEKHCQNNKIFDLQKQILAKSALPFRTRSFRDTESEAEIIKGNISSIKEKYEQKDKSYQEEMAKERGKILSLEHRHSKRQRVLNEEATAREKLAPPDIIPSVNKPSIFSGFKSKAQGLVKPMSPKKVSPSWSGRNHGSKRNIRKHNDDKSCDDTYESNSQTSESTEFTRVSDTQANSEFESYKKCGSLSLDSQDTSISSQQTTLRNSKFKKKPETNGFTLNDSENESLTYGILEAFRTIEEVKNKQFFNHLENNKIYDSNKRADSNYYKTPKNISRVQTNPKFTTDDFDKIDIISTKSLSQKNFEMNQSSAPSIYESTGLANMNGPTTTKVFRVEINPSTHGMQIAMGLRDRVKKTKDLKNAWKRFIGMATSKFSNIKASDSNTKLDVDYVEKDEGISSLIDENFSIYDDIDKQKDDNRDKQRQQQKYLQNCAKGLSRTNSRRSHKELDSGYMSTDSGESRINNKKIYYERFNGDRHARICEDIADNDEEDEQSDETLSEKHDDSNEKLCNPKSRTNSIEKPTQSPPLPPENKATLKTIHTKSVPQLTPVASHEKKQYIFSLSPPTHPPPPPPISKSPPTTPVKPHTANLNFQFEEAMPIKTCSTDDEFSSDNSLTTTDSGDDPNEFLCESGAESMETNSVFFKQVRKLETCNNEIDDCEQF